jgi:Ca2+-binding RTX toxin-like protein
MNRINGSSIDDTLMGTAGDDEIYGLGGNDRLYTNGGHDKLYGGDGSDFLDASQRNDPATGKWKENFDGAYLDGGAGDDTFYGSHGDDTLIGGDGDDKLISQGGKDQIDGGNGNDLIDASQRYDVTLAKWVTNADGATLDGGAGDDKIYGSHGDDVIHGGDGNDTIYSEGGKDKIYGGNGDDLIDASQHWDATTGKWVTTTDGAYIDGGAGADRMFGGSGNDTYVIDNRLDAVFDKGGNDTGIVNVDWAKTSTDIENWTWAPGVQKLPYWLDALTNADAPLLGVQVGATHVVKYCFAQTPASFFNDKDKNQFSPFNADQIAYMKKVLAYIESVINVHFVETTDAEGTYTIVMANNKQEHSAGYGGQISDHPGGIFMMALSQYAQNPSGDNGGEFYRVALHEIGHTLGLKHPFGELDADGGTSPGPYLPKLEDKFDVTVMSYTGQKSIPGGTYGPLDIDALQFLYGASATFNAGDTTYTVKADSSLMVGDGAGVDTIDGSAQTKAITMYLEAGYWSHVGDKADTITAAGQFTVNFGSVIENALGGSGADQIVGNGAANVIDGGAGDDVLDGAAGDDKLVGGVGNDKLVGGAGNDRLDGSDGLDTAVFAGTMSGFTLAHGADGWTVTDKAGTLGVDTLVGVERLAFADGGLALDLDGTAAQAYRLYAAAFNRTPDAGGLGYWLAALDRGMSLDTIAAMFTQNDEFTKMYGATRSAESFLDTVYHNILHRSADPDGFQFWAKAMHDGWSEGQVLALFSESAENKAQVVGQIEHGIAYQPYGTA